MKKLKTSINDKGRKYYSCFLKEKVQPKDMISSKQWWCHVSKKYYFFKK